MYHERLNNRVPGGVKVDKGSSCGDMQDIQREVEMRGNVGGKSTVN